MKARYLNPTLTEPRSRLNLRLHLHRSCVLAGVLCMQVLVTGQAATSDLNETALDHQSPQSTDHIDADIPPPSRPDQDDPQGGMLVNLSTHGLVAGPDHPMIAGLIIHGAPITVAIRALGPSLGEHVRSPLALNPALELYRGGTRLETNEDWQEAENAEDIEAQSFAPTHASESVIFTRLEPGEYTTLVRNRHFDNEGLALVEVFHAGGEGRLINLSTRGMVVSENEDFSLITGFMIRGGPMTVASRTLGPSLIDRGVIMHIEDPWLELMQGQENIGLNDNWRDSETVTPIIARSLDPARDAEPALLSRLEEGAYTLVSRGIAARDQGNALVELFATGSLSQESPKPPIVSDWHRHEFGPDVSELSDDEILFWIEVLIENPNAEFIEFETTPLIDIFNQDGQLIAEKQLIGPKEMAPETTTCAQFRYSRALEEPSQMRADRFEIRWPEVRLSSNTNPMRSFQDFVSIRDEILPSNDETELSPIAHQQHQLVIELDGAEQLERLHIETHYFEPGESPHFVGCGRTSGFRGRPLGGEIRFKSIQPLATDLERRYQLLATPMRR